MTSLADYTTLGLGGPARNFVSAAGDAELIEAVRAADAAAEPVLLIGGGSNLVISDEGFGGTVIHVNTRGLTFAEAGDGVVNVTVAAGEDWDSVVAVTVAEGLSGLETLSGIPGRAGATPIQNVGAYGREVAEVITEVRVYDRQEDQVKVIPNEGCAFAYRTSLFKAAGPRHVVLAATFRLARQPASMPVKYAELATELGVAAGERASVGEVRSAVLKIRARKGMVLCPGDPDTRSVGSFFTNPIVSAGEFARVGAAAAGRGVAGPVPGYPAGEGLVKLSAAWLIERSGFAKGYGAPAPARVSTKHTLALTNTGNATTADLVALAREIVDGVQNAFGVTLTPEPTLIGVTL